MLVPREYKLLLRPAMFRGDERDEAIDHLWDRNLVRLLERTEDAEPDGEAFQKDEDRVIRFWDTRSRVLRSAGYVFRERVKLDKGKPIPKKRRVSLKYRNRDHGRAAVKDMRALDAENSETKLETDIGAAPGETPPIRLIFSHSTKQEIGEGKKLNRLDDPLKLFPKLGQGLDEEEAPFHAEDEISVVSGLQVHERIYEGPRAILAGAGTGFSLALWFKKGESPKQSIPMIAELSFKLSAKDLSLGTDVIDVAEDLFEQIQKTGWFDPESTTKTRFVYRYRGP